MTGASNVWLYAVVEAGRPPPAGRTGVAGEALQLIGGPGGGPGVVAVAGLVPRADFDEAPLQAHLEDAVWLERLARTHHQVIDELARGGPCLPMRLATLYHDEQGVTGMLRERREELVRALAAIAGRSEWGVKAYLPRTAAPASTASADGQIADDKRPGTAYLLRRKNENEQRREGLRHAVDEAQEIHAWLAGSVASAAQRHPLQSAEASGRREPMVLNGAYLIADDQRADFESAVESLAARHPELHLEVTGPWPAYSFSGIGTEPEAER